MKKFATTLAGTLLIGCGAAGAALPDEIDRLAKPYVDSETVVGMTIGVVKGDQMVIRGYGRLSADDSMVPDGETIYEIGSVSKVFTGTLLADAVVSGRVSLVTPADDLLPKGVTMPRRDDALPIRLWHLATHTSGLPRLPDNMEPADPNNPYADYDGKRLAAFLRSYKPRKKPGEVFEYSNFGAGLLGELLARERKTKYEALLKDRIAEPLGLSSTGITLDAKQSERLAPPHLDGGAPGHAWDLGKLEGAGAIRSSADDLLRFARAQLDPPEGKLGQAIDLAWMIHQKPLKESDFAMGLGWHVAKDGSTRWHNGQTGGYHSAMFVSRPLGAAVVVLTNTATGEVDALAEQLIRLTAGSNERPRKFEEAVRIGPEVANRYAGVYRFVPGIDLRVRARGDRLMVQLTGQSALPIYPRTETEWFTKVVEATLRFEVDESGECVAVELDQNGVRQRAARVE